MSFIESSDGMTTGDGICMLIGLFMVCMIIFGAVVYFIDAEAGK
jgi:hypothetical protein